MNITISARLAMEQKISAETKQQLGRQKLISRELILVNMEFSKCVQYASETDDKEKKMIELAPDRVEGIEDCHTYRLSSAVRRRPGALLSRSGGITHQQWDGDYYYC